MPVFFYDNLLVLLAAAARQVLVFRIVCQSNEK